MLNWLAGFILFWAGVYAIYRIWMTREDIQTRILWTLIVALLPLIGLVIWWFYGPK